MAINKIPQEEIYRNSVARLANRPTAATRFGQGGLSPTELKEWYDKLALLCINKLHELIDAINADASETSIAALIDTPITDLDDTERHKTLYDVLLDITGGDLAGYLALNGLNKGNLQAELTDIENNIKSLADTLGTDADTADKLGTVFARLAFLHEIIGSSGETADAPESIHSRLDKLFKMQWGSGNLEDSSVTAAKIANGEVTTSKLADKAVTTAKMANDAVTGSKIADYSVSGSKIAENAVGETKLDNATREKINSPISSVDYNSNTGVLSFGTISGKNINVDLPLELMVRDGYYAKEYSEKREYNAGEYCTHGGALYRCITVTSGTFNANSWEAVNGQAESEREIILELFAGGVIEIPTRDIAGDIVVDSELSETSENPVKNKVIAAALKKVSANVPTFDLIALGLPDIPVTGTSVSVKTDATEIVEAFNKGAVRLIFSLFGIRCEAISHSLYITDAADSKQSLCSCVVNINGLNCLVNISFHDDGISGVFSILDNAGVSSWNDLTDKPFGENEDGTVTQLDNKYLSILELEAGKDVLLPTTTGTTSVENLFGYNLLCLPALTDEETYNKFTTSTKPIKVMCDGVEYVCDLQNVGGNALIGNVTALGGSGNDEPFAAMCISNGEGTYAIIVAFINDTTPADHTVSIYQDTEEKTYKLKEEYLLDANQPVSIDLSKFDTDGTIMEKYADGTLKTTTMEFDDNGNPTKITDGNGNVTVLTW